MELLINNDIKALIATSALGMGYDKPDLGFVIHYQAPNSVISYYQQVGRAGGDQPDRPAQGRVRRRPRPGEARGEARRLRQCRALLQGPPQGHQRRLRLPRRSAGGCGPPRALGGRHGDVAGADLGRGRDGAGPRDGRLYRPRAEGAGLTDARPCPWPCAAAGFGWLKHSMGWPYWTLSTHYSPWILLMPPIHRLSTQFLIPSSRDTTYSPNFELFVRKKLKNN